MIIYILLKYYSYLSSAFLSFFELLDFILLRMAKILLHVSSNSSISSELMRDMSSGTCNVISSSGLPLPIRSENATSTLENWPSLTFSITSVDNRFFSS